MKMNSLLKASAIALGLTLANTSMAQTAPEAQATETATKRADKAERGDRSHRGDKRHHHHRYMKQGHMHGFKGDVGLVVPGYGPVSQKVVDSLELSDAQKAKIEEIKSSIKTQMEERRDSKEHPMAAVAEVRSKQLADGKLDPQAMLEERQKVRESMRDRRGEFSDEWLAVWNDLNDEQQAKVATYFQEVDAKRAERFERMKEKRKERGDK